MQTELTKKMVDSWLKDVSAVLGVCLELNKEGICTFQVGENIIAIEVAIDIPQVYIYSTLCHLPVDDEKHKMILLSKALELNAFQMHTHGGAIAMVPGGELLIYCCSVSVVGMDSEKFSGILGTFFDVLPELKAHLV